MQNSLLGTILLGILTLPAIGQTAQPDSPKCGQNFSLAEFLLPEDANAAKDAFRSFRSALLNGDRKYVVEHVAFPLDLVVSGSGLRLKDAHDLLDHYTEVFTPFVVSSLGKQDPEQLTAGWDGVSLPGGALRLVREKNGYLVGDVVASPVKLTGDVAEFLSKRLTCPPLVLEGRVIAYHWASRMPAFEDIYVDHFIVDVTKVLSGSLPQHRIRVDFWGVLHLPEYNLPQEAYDGSHVWRMYLRPVDNTPENREVCDKNVQETVSFVDEETGREVESQSAMVSLTGESEGTLTYVGLPCFEAKKQYFTPENE